jgi:hypothetical protein
MCDYSLLNVRNRLAVQGEPLQIHRFPSGSLGLASPADMRSASHPSTAVRRSWWEAIKNLFGTDPAASLPAVCVPPGARLILREIPAAIQTKLGVSEEEEVTFVQLSPSLQSYRDALRFQNGQEVLLQRLLIGQQLDVLTLATSPATESPSSAALNQPVRESHTTF